MHDRDGELDDMRGKAVEAERERNNLSSEIDNLNDWRRNELLAHEHARKLLQTGSNPFIRSDSKHRREKGARTIQRYWSMHRTKKRQNSFVSDYNWAVDVVQDGFDKYQTDREVISNPKPTQPSVANEIEPIHTADVYTQTEELVLINLLQELKDRVSRVGILLSRSGQGLLPQLSCPPWLGSHTVWAAPALLGRVYLLD